MTAKAENIPMEEMESRLEAILRSHEELAARVTEASKAIEKFTRQNEEAVRLAEEFGSRSDEACRRAQECYRRAIKAHQRSVEMQYQQLNVHSPDYPYSHDLEHLEKVFCRHVDEVIRKAKKRESPRHKYDFKAWQESFLSNESRRRDWESLRKHFLERHFDDEDFSRIDRLLDACSKCCTSKECGCENDLRIGKVLDELCSKCCSSADCAC